MGIGVGCRRLAGERRLRGDGRGVVGVEMAVLALPFLLLGVAVLELALMIVVAGALDDATHAAARDAQLAVGEPSPDEIALTLCAVMPAMVGDCRARLVVTTERLPPSTGQAPIIVVRSTYDWPPVTPLIGRLLAGAGGSLTFRAASAFRQSAA